MRHLVGFSLCVLVTLSMAVNVDAAGYQPTTIYAIQQGAITVGDSVIVDSVVVSAIDLKPTTFGFNAQEIPGGPYSGILCYMGYERPDTVGGAGLAVGDLVRVKGEYQEYPATEPSVSEIQVHKVTIIQEDYGEPSCELLSCGDLGYGPWDSTFAEQWEGVFICVDTVIVVDIGSYAEWTVIEYHNHPGSGFGDSLRIDDKLIDPTLTPPDIGDTLAFIKGVYSEEWGNYRLWPRSTDDLIFMGPTPGPHLLLAFASSDTSMYAIFDRKLDEASAENTDNYYLESGTAILNAALNLGDSVTVRLITDPQPATQLDSLVACDIQSSGGTPMFECEKYGFIAGITPISYIQTPAHAGTDSSQIEGEQATIAGVVTSSSADFGGPFFMRDSAGPWNGIFIYWPGSNVSVGDSIVISGVVDEYYGLTELASIDYKKELTTGVPVSPDIVTPDLIRGDAPTAESYEGTLVKMDSVEVFTYLDWYDEWTVGAGSDTVKVGDYATYSYPGYGSIIHITGGYRYNYGEFKLEPRGDGDIVVVDSCTAGVRDRDSFRPRLYQNAPNPFISGTSIRFTIPFRMQAKVAIYDISGRLVRVVTDGVAAPGEHNVKWDGRDNFGAEVSSGIYFYRLTTPKVAMQKKMVLLR